MSEPPTQDEFNNKWLSPIELISLLTGPMTSYAAQRYAIRRLKAGTYIARARAGPDRNGAMRSFIVIDPRFWDRLYDPPEEFWEVGDATFRVGGITGYGDYTEIEFLDVRFDPNCLSSDLAISNTGLEFIDYNPPSFDSPEPRTAELTQSPPLAEDTPTDEPEKTKEKIRNQDLKRVARLVAEIWGTEITGREALAIARGCFPEHHIGEKRFLPEYRFFRDPKNPGPKPKIG